MSTKLSQKGNKMSKKASSVATTKKTSKKVTEKHSVPKINAEEHGDKMDVNKLIGAFAPKIPISQPKTKKEDRPTIDINEEIQRDFIEFSAIKEISKIASENEKSMNKNITNDIFESYLDVLWETKTQPQNPSIKCYDENNKLDATGLFVISTGSRIKINMPDLIPGKTHEESLVQVLFELGIEKEKAKTLVSQEVSFVPEWKVNFTDLLVGKTNPSNPVQKNAGGKLFLALQGQDCEGNILSLQDRIEILSQIDEDGWFALRENLQNQTTYVPSMADGDGFLDRVCNYANSREELGAIMTVFKPVISLRSVAFAVSDSSSQHENRLLDKCKELVQKS